METSDSDDFPRILDVEQLAGLLKADGKLAKNLSGFELRPGQIDMLKMVGESFNNGLPMIAEAGTGIGKSFAYLLPALKWALQNDERVVVSTATIALQQQLMDKDIPLAMKILGEQVNVALVKGRGNYLCWKRFNDTLHEGNDLFVNLNTMKTLLNWADKSTDGEKSSIPFQPESSLWNRICCEADACAGTLCEFYEKCFFMRSRRRAAKASLMVANHHLLFADLAARLEGAGLDETAVLPPYAKIVFDEAHHAENAATSLFTEYFSLPFFNRYLRRLYRRRGRVSKGLLTTLAERIPVVHDFLIKDIPPLIDNVQSKAELMDSIGSQLLENTSTLRLAGEPGEAEKLWFIPPLSDLYSALDELLQRLVPAVTEIENNSTDNDILALVVETGQTLSILQKTLNLIDSFLQRNDYDDYVFWMQMHGRSDGSKNLVCYRTPLSVADMIQDAVWEPYDTVVAVSATLALGGSFDYWKKSIGASQISGNIYEGIFPSPFDFSSQVMLGIPDDAPVPSMQNEWQDYLITTIINAIKICGGHALILFTSYETLTKVCDAVRAHLGEELLVLVQGEDDRARLLGRFRDNPSSVLFATDSFWEGVDIPGDALQLVVITRLPFRPPTDPLAQARGEKITASGANAFFDLTVPEALRRFRQGFGRLMRRKNDFGAVLILDSRIIHKSYGHIFRNSLPPTRQVFCGTEGVLRELEEFIASKQKDGSC